MILTILSREPLHGYRVSQRLAELSRDTFQVNPGSLFPALYRLDQDGKLKAEWRPSENNRNVKYYKRTASGKKQLQEHRQRWDRIALAITSVLEGVVILLSRLKSILRWLIFRRAAGQELDDENQSRIDMSAAEKMRSGIRLRKRFGARKIEIRPDEQDEDKPG